MNASYEQLDALRKEKREAKSKMMELKEKITMMKRILDQKKRLKKLPEFLFEKYVTSGRLTDFYHVCRMDYFTLTLDDNTHHWYANEGPPDNHGRKEIEQLVKNKNGEHQEDAEWWNKILAMVRPPSYPEGWSVEETALLYVFYYRCQNEDGERCC